MTKKLLQLQQFFDYLSVLKKTVLRDQAWNESFTDIKGNFVDFKEANISPYASKITQQIYGAMRYKPFKPPCPQNTEVKWPFWKHLYVL